VFGQCLLENQSVARKLLRGHEGNLGWMFFYGVQGLNPGGVWDKAPGAGDKYGCRLDRNTTKKYKKNEIIAMKT